MNLIKYSEIRTNCTKPRSFDTFRPLNSTEFHATKFLYVNTVSDKVVRHSLAYLSVQKWFAWGILTT